MADIAYKGDTLVECQGTTSAGIDFRWVMLRLTILSSPCEGSLPAPTTACVCAFCCVAR